MGFKLIFSGAEGKMVTEPYSTATATLARRSELLAYPNKPVLFVTNDVGQDLDETELEDLALEENRHADRP